MLLLAKTMKKKIECITNGVKNMTTIHNMIMKLESLNYDGHKLKTNKTIMS